MSSVKSARPPHGWWGIFIFLIALGIIQMDIGGRTDCLCRLHDKFSFRSTPAHCFVCNVSFLLVSRKILIINYRLFVCGWLRSILLLCRLKIPSHLWSFLSRFLSQMKIDCSNAIVRCRSSPFWSMVGFFVINFLFVRFLLINFGVWRKIEGNFNPNGFSSNGFKTSQGWPYLD